MRQSRYVTGGCACKNIQMKPYFFSISLLLAASLTAQQETSFSTAKKHYQEENYQEALKYFTRAAVEEPENAFVPYLTGRVYLDLSNYKQSAAYLEKAISMDTSRSNWVYELGLVYYAIPDYRKSLYYIELAGERGYRKTTDYLENLANAYVNVKQYDRAAELFGEVLKKKPTDQQVLYQLAQAQFNGAKYQEAINNWDQVLELNKENAEALYMIGLSYQKLGDKQKGQQLCDKAIEMDPSLRSKRQQQGGGPL